MKKVFIFLLTASALVAASTTNQSLENYAQGCSLVAATNTQGDLIKVEQACYDCIQKIKAPDVDLTDNNVKFMVSKCVEKYKSR